MFLKPRENTFVHQVTRLQLTNLLLGHPASMIWKVQKGALIGVLSSLGSHSGSSSGENGVANAQLLGQLYFYGPHVQYTSQLSPQTLL